MAAELDGLVEQVEAAISTFRDVARGIYPPLLANAGPAAALADAAVRLPAAITVDGASAQRLDEVVETTAYFCCLEAIQNAVRHAPGATVTVRLETEGGVLRFEVRDDGPGFDPAAAASGRGRSTIADRVGAVGGDVRWETAPGRGTAVIGEIPAPAQRPS
jgi:signal transduction histidine kinase